MSSAPTRSPRPSPRGGHRRPRGTVLLVDDDPAVRRVTGRVLRTFGFAVVESASGAAALAELEQRAGRVDLIVSDILMADGNGPELSDAVRERWPELPLLFITGYPGDAMARHGLARGDRPLLPKPFTPDELLGAVDELLRG